MSKRMATLALVSVAGAALLCAATPAAKKPVHKSTAAKHSSSTTTVHKTHTTTARKPATKRRTTSTAHRSSRRRVSSSRRVVHHSYLRSGPQAPTADRYKEIQQALAERGYYHGEVNGVWGQDSADALKRFQTDQHLDADGKLDSLSLIGLGLGPKRTLSAHAAKPDTDEP